MDYLEGTGDPFATVSSNSFGVDFSAMNKGVTPIFFTEPVEDRKATEDSGHITFREEERVRIIVAGDMLNQAVHPVDDAIRERFSEAYTRWKANKTRRHIEGVPIKAWPILSQLEVAQFEAIGIFSVENLRDISDTNLSKIAEGRQWREKARAWLESAKGGAEATRLAAENERLREDVEGLKKQVAEMAAMLDEKTRPKSKAA
jgi:hypothetical protein